MTQQTSESQDHNTAEGRHYIKLLVDGLNILLQDNALQSIEPARALNVDAKTSRSVGLMATNEDSLVAYCLNSRLQLMNEMPLSRRVSIIVRARQDSIAIMCERAERIEFGMTPRLLPVPDCMHYGRTPVSHLSIHDGTVYIVVRTQDLLEHIYWQTSDKMGNFAACQAD